MIDTPCIFCNQNDNAQNVIKENGYQGKKCTPCNLIYISPRPSLEEIANLYGHDQAHLSANSHIAQERPKKLHALHTLNIIKRHMKSGNLLELGAGAGYFLAQAKMQGFTPHGIELNPVQAAFIRDSLNIPCQETPLAANSWEGKTFDIIYHSDVLSHFYDPIQAMHAIWASLNPGGYLVFETGNIADIHPKYYAAFNAMQYPDHLFFFGHDSLNQLLNLTGFTLKEYHSYSILPQLRIMKLVKKLKKTFFKETPSQSHGENNSKLLNNEGALKGLARTQYHSIMHSLRYKIGNYLPKAQRPQTVIIVAQKNG